MAKIIVADDEMLIRRLVCDFLIKEGHTPLEAADGKMAVELFNQNPDTALIIMDIMMPELDGWEATREIRRHSAVPIMLLSARSQDFDQLTGFESGADDYVTKPFGIMELLSRIRSILRRSGKPTDKKGELLSFGTIRADRNRHIVTVDEKEVAVTLKEFQLLCYLLLNKGIVLSREQIMQAVWDIPFEMESRTIDMHIMSLRQKLGGEGAAIRTIRGVGYRLGEREK